jgi:putative PIN family toxin of toxin-antitoxin system
MKKNKLFVLDANTLISAFLLSRTSIAAQAYYKIKSDGHIIVSDETFDEFTNVFIRPKFDRYLSLDKRLIIIEDLKSIIKVITVSIKINSCRDPKDNKFLELAVEAGAACIVTGDKDLLVLHPYAGIPILTAADFLRTFQ